MAGLVFACIAPHGSEVIEELGSPLVGHTAATRQALEEVGRRMRAARPDTVIVLTPHGVRVAGAVCVMTTERAFGVLEGPGGRVEVDMAVDQALAEAVAARAAQAHGVPVATAIYGASAGDGCFTPLDWGAVVPLWFLGARWTPQPAVISITPSRVLPLAQLAEFGTALAEAAAQAGRRVALIASADWGHAHRADGPYGIDPASAEFDAMVVDVVKADDLERLLTTDLDFAARATVDGLWQAVMLAGALRHTPMRGEFLAYEVPSYFGMMVAAYEPLASSG
jgi:aromatic ring-opening dioxygenase LigB subunit